MDDKTRAYLYLHFCVLIWGFTAILGKLISLQALPLVWWRVLVCSATLFLLIPFAQFRQISRQMLLRMVGVGVLVGLHWICFYGAIKLSNASVAVVTMATTSFFSALTEPLILRRPVKMYELALGVFILPGMWLIAGNIDFQMRLGLGLGIFGAFLAAIFTALNKKIVDHADHPAALPMSFVELFAAFLICSVFLPFSMRMSPEMPVMLQGWDWLWLFILAWVCTLLPYYLTLKAMRHVSAFVTNLIINLEPVYGVVLAALIFREDKDLKLPFYIGVFIILIAVFGHPLVKKRFDKPVAEQL